MTEIEKTIEQLERVSKNLGCIGEDEDCTETAILALEEVQKYRALEKRLADMFGGSLTLEIVMDELEQQLKEPDSPHPVNARILTHKESAEWDAYRAIGTPEECKAAREKQTARRALHPGCYDKDGIWHEWNGINGKPYELCPSCGVNLCCEMPTNRKPEYCKECGQKLDWSDEG